MPYLMPVLFVAHGAPSLALDAAQGAELTQWASRLPRPRSILCISAHWERSPPTLGALEHSRLIYDFSGFSDELYRLTYAAPGAPELAAEVQALLAPHYSDIQNAPARHLDHGVWVPMRWLYPQADVPVLQLSLPRDDAAAALELGLHLATLREREVLIVASGVVVHNLSRLTFGPKTVTPTWALEFDGWCADAVQRWAVEDVVNYRTRAPRSALAHPTEEHFTPLLVAIGAASAEAPSVSFPITGFEYGSLSRRCIQFG